MATVYCIYYWSLIEFTITCRERVCLWLLSFTTCSLLCSFGCCVRGLCFIWCWCLSSTNYWRNGGYSSLLDGVNSILYIKSSQHTYSVCISHHLHSFVPRPIFLEVEKYGLVLDCIWAWLGTGNKVEILIFVSCFLSAILCTYREAFYSRKSYRNVAPYNYALKY